MPASYNDYIPYWCNLNEVEREYVFQHAENIHIIYSHKKTAEAEAIRRFNKSQLHNGAGDAFRHCYGSALLARDLGYSEAKRITDNHEKTIGQPISEKKMDIFNNNVGLAIGRNCPHATNSMLANKCYAAYKAGKLQICDIL